jgi:protocatechuate 3,4-dioxygenase alpha subunit
VAQDGSRPSGAGSLRRDGFTFTGWGRASTDDEGRYSFSTLVPGAPFFALTVFARGLLDRLFTRAYLPDHADDPFLAGLGADRRATLVAAREPRGFRFDIRLQGEGETVFLTYPRH